MNAIKYVASKAYSQYLEKGKGQLSPDDALWITDQYVEENPTATVEEAIDAVLEQLLYDG
jgi:hypothetical protein